MRRPLCDTLDLIKIEIIAKTNTQLKKIGDIKFGQTIFLITIGSVQEFLSKIKLTTFKAK